MRGNDREGEGCQQDEGGGGVGVSRRERMRASLVGRGVSKRERKDKEGKPTDERTKCWQNSRFVGFLSSDQVFASFTSPLLPMNRRRVGREKSCSKGERASQCALCCVRARSRRLSRLQVSLALPLSLATSLPISLPFIHQSGHPHRFVSPSFPYPI